MDYDDGRGRGLNIIGKGVLAISPNKQFGAGKTAHAVCELQRLQFKSPEGVRLAREMWEILRRKKGCSLSRLYRNAQDDALWLAYSEWTSLGELAGARREAARSPLNRRLHSTLASSSERAYEPFGPVRSTHGVNFASGPVAMLINFLDGIEEPETALALLAAAPGYISHILMHEVGKPESLTCLAHFDTADNAGQAAHQLSEQPALKEFNPVAELFSV